MSLWDDRVFVVAEAGVNHNGSTELALALVDGAADAGADAVKFQVFNADELVVPGTEQAAYQERNAGVRESQHAMLRRLEIDEAMYDAILARATERGIIAFATGFDLGSLRRLAAHRPPVWKIPSGEITNYRYLVEIAQQRTPTILSTGMATLAEVDAAVSVLLEHGLKREQISVLHCTTDYPAQPADVNLRALVTVGQVLGVAPGYSDHTEGVAIPYAAVALGARVIEKHMTLDRTMQGPDHAASMEVAAFAEMVAGIRAISAALGDGVKRPREVEGEYRRLVRKGLVASVPIAAGERFTEANVTARRPAEGIDAMEWPRVIGRTAPRSFVPNEPIEL